MNSKIEAANTVKLVIDSNTKRGAKIFQTIRWRLCRKAARTDPRTCKIEEHIKI